MSLYSFVGKEQFAGRGALFSLAQKVKREGTLPGSREYVVVGL